MDLFQPPPTFRQISSLTADENSAAVTYTSSAALLHHLMQGHDGMDCPQLQAALDGLSDVVRHLRSAAEKYELEKAATFYTGLRNSYSALGSLVSTSGASFVGLEFRYGGVFSTSAFREVALDFMDSGNRGRRALLTIEARAGLRGLPTSVLGAGSGHEGEFIVAANSSFRIDAVEVLQSEYGEYRNIRLSGPL